MKASLSGLIGLLTVLSINTAATDLYRYKDDKGRWQYTDKKPYNPHAKKDLQAVELKPSNRMNLDIDNLPSVIIPKHLCPEDARRRSIYHKDRGGYFGKKGDFQLVDKSKEKSTPSLWAINDYFIPVEMRLFFVDNTNMQASPTLPLTVVIPPQQQQKVAQLQPDNPLQGWSYNYSYQYQLGDGKARHDQRCYYLPPVPPGRAYRVTQAFNGHFSHNSDYSRYAVDIAMPEGTPIYASRDGLVIRRKTEYVLAGLKQSFKSRANSIALLHGDGTISIYAHLQFRSIRVHEGMSVKAGEVIAKSGNTGYSTGPHLHFEVVRNSNLHWYSLPFQYMDHAGNIFTPVQGLKLSNQSPHPNYQP